MSGGWFDGRKRKNGALPTMIGAFGDAGMFHAGFTLTGLLVTASTALLWFIRLPENL